MFKLYIIQCIRTLHVCFSPSIILERTTENKGIVAFTEINNFKNETKVQNIVYEVNEKNTITCMGI